MNKRFLIVALVMTVFVMVYEFLVHGLGLKGIYESTASVWRSPESMQAYFAWMSAGQILLAVMFCCLYTCTRCRGSLTQGMTFGLIVGLLLSSFSISMYAVLPIPFALVLLWVAAGLIETVIMGAIVYYFLGEK